MAGEYKLKYTGPQIQTKLNQIEELSNAIDDIPSIYETQENVKTKIEEVTQSISNKANKSSTLAGYGITDAATKTDFNALSQDLSTYNTYLSEHISNPLHISDTPPEDGNIWIDTSDDIQTEVPGVSAVLVNGSKSMTGNLTVKKSDPTIWLENTNNGSQAYLQTFDNVVGLGNRNIVSDENNMRTLLIRNSNGSQPELKESAALMDIVDGTKTIYNLYGEHNKPLPADIGAVDKTGDKMTGNLIIEKAEAPTFQGINTTTGRDVYVVSTSDNYTTVANRIAGDQNNRVALWLAPETETDDKLLRIHKVVNSVGNTYRVYHEGNKPAPADIGAATQAEVDELKTSVSEGKALIAAAVTDKGVETAATDIFAVMASNIESIETGSKIISGTFKTEEFFGSASFTTTDFNKINAYKNFILVKASEDDRSETPYDGYYYTVRNVIALFKIDNSFYVHSIGTTVSGSGDSKPYSFYDEITLSLSNRQDVYINKGSGDRNYDFRPGSYRYIAWN